MSTDVMICAGWRICVIFEVFQDPEGALSQVLGLISIFEAILSLGQKEAKPAKYPWQGGA
jgi:hypothetical protein